MKEKLENKLHTTEATDGNTSTGRGNNGAVQSISRAVDLLCLIMEGHHSISDLVGRSGLSIATVHRILRTLEETGTVFQDKTDRKYYLGPLFTRFALNKFNEHHYFIAQSQEEVDRISELSGEFTVLDIMAGMQKISLLSLHSKFSYGVSRVSMSIFYGAESKILMSQYSDSELDVILNCYTPRPVSDRCITDKERLKGQFREARRQGYYICREFSEDMMGISVAIKSYLCPAALTVVGPENRLGPITAKVLEEMQNSALRIDANIAKCR